MPSLFSRKKSLKGGEEPPPFPTEPVSPKKGGKKKAATIDEHGRMGTQSKREIRRSQSERAMTSLGFHDAEEELQLLFGHWPVEPERELDLQAVTRVLEIAGGEIKNRGLDSPLVFSTRNLDLSCDANCSLIRDYFANRVGWQRDIQFASPPALASMIKWALGRIVNPQGGRGFLAWDMYERWRAGEREKQYPPRYFTTHLLFHLPTQTAALLQTLLDLLSSTAAYSLKNGMTPRKLASLFSPYIFGLPDDEVFDATYTAWMRHTHATEHMLLAYVRDQKISAAVHLPARLEDYIRDYPDDLQSNISMPSKTARLNEVKRIRRLTRFYSKNLILGAGSWEVQRSQSWPRLLPLAPPDPSMSSTTLVSPPGPAFTQSYRHLLNIKNLDLEELDIEGGDVQKYKSVVDKQWSSFRDIGFSEGLVGSKKLDFDLTEGERVERKTKHGTIDWNTFESSGFAGRETYLEHDLDFSSNLTKSVTSWPEQSKELQKSLRKTEKALPPFPYNIEPVEEPAILVDESFFEAWADVLVSSGWTRDESKESSWALIQWKYRGDAAAPSSRDKSDGRTSEQWFLVEEFVPTEYRHDLIEGRTKKSKRQSFLKSVRRKNRSQNTKDAGLRSTNYSTLSSKTSPVGGSRPTMDDVVFHPAGSTQYLSLSSDRPTSLAAQGSHMSPLSLVPSNAPSTSVSDGGHERGNNPPPLGGRSPSPQFIGRGVGGTLSSQRSSRWEKKFGDRLAPPGAYSDDGAASPEPISPPGPRAQDDSWIDMQMTSNRNRMAGQQWSGKPGSNDEHIRRIPPPPLEEEEEVPLPPPKVERNGSYRGDAHQGTDDNQSRSVREEAESEVYRGSRVDSEYESPVEQQNREHAPPKEQSEQPVRVPPLRSAASLSSRVAQLKAVMEQRDREAAAMGRA